jgi:hypothetical protein
MQTEYRLTPIFALTITVVCLENIGQNVSYKIALKPVISTLSVEVHYSACNEVDFTSVACVSHAQLCTCTEKI